MSEFAPFTHGRSLDMTTNVNMIEATLDTLGLQIAEMQLERERIAKTLATFWAEPLSISSIQPLMDLARELNPHLR